MKLVIPMTFTSMGTVRPLDVALNFASNAIASTIRGEYVRNYLLRRLHVITVTIIQRF